MAIHFCTTECAQGRGCGALAAARAAEFSPSVPPTVYTQPAVAAYSCNCYGGPDRGCFMCPLRTNGYTVSKPPYVPRHAKPKAVDPDEYLGRYSPYIRPEVLTALIANT